MSKMGKWTVGEHPENGCWSLLNPEGEIVHVYGPEMEDRRDARWRAKFMNMSLLELEQIGEAVALLKGVFK